MAAYGAYLLIPLGGERDVSLGLYYTTAAAQLGSKISAYHLGNAFKERNYGLPRDEAQARFWLKRVIDDKYEDSSIDPDTAACAENLLRELS